ncbi:kinase-like domain-containing protein [Gigaspora rosea]|uniref:Kinase-like domain-containing protein n=1 Tax=Gigaspora rosea TaxID=44941 RepID=A0A397U9V8_9GLOM|nr:kinase-like domain-containing protein [Gigaspora rosea]
MNSKSNEIKVCGLTQNTITNEYMFIFDEFGSKRNCMYGKCANCSRYNTSYSWCKSCDPHKTVQGWTSGNKDVDDCIIEFQLKATRYEDVIEWIPFNKLVNIQKIGDKVLATWLDGIRQVKKNYIWKQSQPLVPSYNVELKILHDSQNLLDLLNNFKDLMQLNNSELKVYGLTQGIEGFPLTALILVFNFIRDDENGTCANCNRYNTSKVWCRTCDPQKTTQGWTSGNKNIDDCIKEFQLKAINYEDVIEWIHFNRLDNIQKIGEGGFGSVFSATWLDGKRIALNDGYMKYKQSRTPSSIVALKTLPGPQKNFLKEINYYITDNKFYLSKKFKKNLIKVHKAKYFHGDFHSGNILQNQYGNGDLISYIADLGLSRKNDESELEDSVYGVIPYVAPEVFNYRPYTIASDIYSFGIIMTEISTGKPPYYDVEYDGVLIIRICDGLRPKFAEGTPDCYIQLANQCMDANPSNRPTASHIYDELSRWYNIVDHSVANDKNELSILEAFQFADKIIPTLSNELPICPKDKLTSKLLSFKNHSELINSLSTKLPISGK